MKKIVLMAALIGLALVGQEGGAGTTQRGVRGKQAKSPNISAPNRSQPLFRQLGFENPAAAAGILYDYGFTGGAPAMEHHDDGPDDPIGCIQCEDQLGIHKSVYATAVAPNATIGQRETLTERLSDQLPPELFQEVFRLLFQGYASELAALGIRSRSDLLNAPQQVLRRAGEIMRRYDVSIGSWDPGLVVLQERLRAAGVNDLNVYTLNQEGLDYASQVLGFEVRNCNHEQALQMIRERSGL